MLGLGSSLVKGAALVAGYIRDGLKLYMPYKKRDGSLQFVGTGSTSFDGTNDYVDLDAHISDFASDTAGTITLWAKTTASGSLDVMFAASNDGDASSDLTISKNASEKLWIFVRDDGSNSLAFTSTASLEQNTWYHIAFTVGATGNAIYVDGATSAGGYDTGSATTQKWFNDVGDLDTLRIGIREDSGGNEYPWQGNIKNVAIWNRALTATEVQNVMYKTYAEVSGRLASGLVSWWALDVDYTDYHGDNDGTNSGSTLDTDLYGGDTPVKPRAIDNAPTVQADAIGAGSASFTASNSNYISIGDIGVNVYAVCMWFKPNAVITSSSGGNKYLMNINSNVYNGIVLGSFTGALDNELITIVDDDQHMSSYESASASISTDWHHLALSWNSTDTTYDIYLDGVLKPNSKHSSPELIDVDNLEFGRRGSGSGYWDGNICQVGIWDAALTQAQIQSVMEKTYEELTASEKTDLVSYWSLDETIESSGSGASFVYDKVDETLGSELWDSPASTDPYTSGSWVDQGTGQLSDDGDALKITYVDHDDGAKIFFKNADDLSSDLTVGKVYKFVCDIKVTQSSPFSLRVNDGSVSYDTSLTDSDWQTFTTYFTAQSTTGAYVRFNGMGSGEIAWIDNLSLKQVNGNAGQLI